MGSLDIFSDGKTSLFLKSGVIKFDLTLKRVYILMDMMDNYSPAECAVAFCTMVTGQPQELDNCFNAFVRLLDEEIGYKRWENALYDGDGELIKSSVSPSSDDKVFSIRQDFDDLYASFRQVYGINLLHEADKITWREFNALLDGLPDGTAVSRKVEIRTYKPKKGEDADYKSKMLRLKQKYRLEED